MNRQALVNGALVVTLFAILLFGWPTLYRYDTLRYSESSSMPVRINRVTGQADMLTGEGWERMKPAEPDPQKSPAELPSEQANRIAIGPGNSFSGQEVRLSLYNGSPWELTEVTVKLRFELPDRVVEEALQADKYESKTRNWSAGQRQEMIDRLQQESGVEQDYVFRPSTGGTHPPKEARDYAASVAFEGDEGEAYHVVKTTVVSARGFPPTEK